MAYIKRRATEKVNFVIETPPRNPVITEISSPLFDWVIENLLKNALDAMEGKGTITIKIKKAPGHVIIDVTDTVKVSASKIFQCF